MPPSGVLSLAEACERLSTPYASEEFAPLAGPGLVVVDLSSGSVTKSQAAVLRRALWSLPCPTLAVAADPGSPTARDVEPAFDVVETSRSELAPVVEGIQRAPLAALALVQLLRGAEARDVEAGLVAESWVYSTLQAGPEFAAWLAGRSEAKPDPSLAPAVLAERVEDRLELVLNRPERRNAFSVEMRDALVEGLQLAVSDPTLSEIVLRGNGPCFSGGGDLNQFGSLPDPATAHTIRTTRSAARLLAACSARTRAVVHGACVGAGAELPAFAGRVEARADAFFLLPELAMGLIPGAGGTVSLPRRIGRQRTAWMALSGERVDAATALDWGLVDEVVEAL